MMVARERLTSHFAALAGIVIGIITIMALVGWLPWATKVDVDTRLPRGEFLEFKAGLTSRLDTIQRTLERIENRLPPSAGNDRAFP